MIRRGDVHTWTKRIGNHLNWLVGLPAGFNLLIGVGRTWRNLTKEWR